MGNELFFSEYPGHLMLNLLELFEDSDTAQNSTKYSVTSERITSHPSELVLSSTNGKFSGGKKFVMFCLPYRLQVVLLLYTYFYMYSN